MSRIFYLVCQKFPPPPPYIPDWAGAAEHSNIYGVKGYEMYARRITAGQVPFSHDVETGDGALQLLTQASGLYT